MTVDAAIGLEQENLRLRRENQQLRDRLAASPPDLSYAIEQQFLFDTGPAHLAYIDVEQVYRFVNKRCQEWFGCPQSEIIGRSLAQIHGAADYAEIRPQVERALTGATVHYVRELVDAAGQHSWLDTTYTPYSVDGGIVGFYASTFDVSERQRAVQALRESEERMTSILQSLDEVVWSTCADGSRLLYLSPAAEAVYGRSVGEFFESPDLWQRVVAAADQNRVAEALIGLMEKGECDIEYRIHRTDGAVRWLRDRARLIRDPSGTPLRIDGFTADVTEAYEYRQALHDERSFLETLVGNLPGMVYRCRNDPDWTMTFVSEGSRELTGYDPVELQAGGSVSYGSLVHPDDRDWLWEKCQVNLERQIPCKNEYRIIRRDGTTGWVWERAIGLYDADNKLQHIEGFVLDITQRKLLEEQLVQTHKLESLGRLAGGIAHDFNNLLTAILGYAELLEFETGSGRPDLNHVAAIRKAGERARDLTRQLLAFARKQRAHPRRLDLSQTLAVSRDLLQRLLRPDVALEFQLTSDLWPINADPGQIDRILLNLAANARDAMPTGGRFVVVTTNLVVGTEDANEHPGVTPGDWVVLRMSDSGTGMSDETKQHLFEPFFTTKPVGAGTGLGLATVHGIVSQNGGHILVQSAQGRGTKIQLYFPRSTQTEPVLNPAPAAVESVMLKHGSERILVVEDDPAVRDLATRCLELGGYSVLSAPSGPQALLLLRDMEAPIDILVTDVVMPEMSGPELAVEVHKLVPKLPVLYMSGYTGSHAKQLGLGDESLEFLPKPFKVKTLLERVRKLLDS